MLGSEWSTRIRRPSNLLSFSAQQLLGQGARLLDGIHVCNGFFSFSLLCISNEAESATTVCVAILNDHLQLIPVNLPAGCDDKIRGHARLPRLFQKEQSLHVMCHLWYARQAHWMRLFWLTSVRNGTKPGTPYPIKSLAMLEELERTVE